MAAVAASCAVARPAAAGDPPVSHLRAQTGDMQLLLDELVDRSATARTLVDRIDRSDLVVYIRRRTFTSTTLDGRIGFVTATPTYRFVIVELACVRSHLVQLVTLAHELQHAVEIADAPAVRDPASLAVHFGQIGIETGLTTTNRTFETDGAAAAGARVRHELLEPDARAADER